MFFFVRWDSIVRLSVGLRKMVAMATDANCLRPNGRPAMTAHHVHRWQAPHFCQSAFRASYISESGSLFRSCRASWSFRGQGRYQWSRRSLLVRASWGADVQFSPAKIIETKKVANNLHRVLVDVGREALAAYTVPGQFVQAKPEESMKPGFFAIASAPDENNDGVIELLIKEQPGTTAEALCRASEGDEILVSPPMGKGFRLDAIPPETYKRLYLFATGSGISPIKASIESGALCSPQRDHITLYYGARNPGAMAYSEKFESWKRDHGVETIPIYSEDGNGYIQDAFIRDGGALSDNASGALDVAALLCGHKGMAEAVTESMIGAGVSKDAILLNF